MLTKVDYPEEKLKKVLATRYYKHLGYLIEK